MDDTENQDDRPIELQETPPELKLVSTLLSSRPRAGAFQFVTFVILFAGVFSTGGVNFSGVVSPLWVEMMSAHLPKILDGEWYRLWSSLFLHADIGHWLANALGLFFFGGMILNYYGFLTFFSCFMILGPLVQYLTLLTYRHPVSLMGASGVVYLLGAVWLTLYVLVDRRRRFMSRMLRAAGVSLVVLAPAEFKPAVSYQAHLLGFLVGVPFGLLVFILQKKKIRSLEAWAMQS